MSRLLLISATCVLLVIGELLMKQGMQQVGELQLSATQLWRTITHWRVALGVLLVLTATFFWLVVISRWQLSYAYPLLSFTFVLIVLGAWWFLGETLTAGKLIGSIIIMIGIIIVMRGGQA